jgi:hypothetical protein
MESDARGAYSAHASAEYGYVGPHKTVDTHGNSRH